MKNVVKFIVLWLGMILSAIFMPILTLCHIEVRMSVEKK